MHRAKGDRLVRARVLPGQQASFFVSDGKQFSNTNLSDLSIVGTCDIFVTKSCDPPDWLIQTCYQSASSGVTETTKNVLV